MPRPPRSSISVLFLSLTHTHTPFFLSLFSFPSSLTPSYSLLYVFNNVLHPRRFVSLSLSLSLSVCVWGGGHETEHLLVEISREQNNLNYDARQTDTSHTYPKKKRRYIWCHALPAAGIVPPPPPEVAQKIRQLAARIPVKCDDDGKPIYNYPAPGSVPLPKDVRTDLKDE